MKRRQAYKRGAPSLMRPEDFGIGQLFERVPDAIIVREAGSARIVLWNPAAEAMFGYGEAEILGHPLSKILPGGLPADRHTAGLLVVPARRKDGQALSIELSSSPIANARVPGDFELAIARDVTARVQAEAALRERAELLDVAHDAIIMLEPDLRITYWNRGAERLYGWPSEEALGRVVSDLLQTRFPVSRDALIDELWRCDLWEGELVHTRRDGSTVVVASRWLLRRNPAGAPVSILDANNDVTLRKRAEDALQESDARFKAFMDAGPVIAFMRDREGRFVYTNQPHQRLLHSQGWIGTSVFAHSPEAQAREILASDRRVLETGEPEQFEETFAYNGETLHLLTYKFPFQGPTGCSLIGSASIDVTSLKRAQAEIRRQAEALEHANAELLASDRFKDEFLAILGHELRTPLNFIISYASVLDEGVVGSLDQQEHEFIKKVLLGADRLLAMVDNLLEMSRFVTKKFKLSRSWTAYADLVDQVIALLAPAATEKRIVLRGEARVPQELWLDGEHLRRVLINLVDNAIKFTGPGGQVTVSAWVEGDRLVTEVRDTGVGISASDLPKLFTRFKQLDMSATRKAGGIGIGLALGKAIVERHGGTLGVTSQPGKGSCFRFEIPLLEPASDEA